MTTTARHCWAVVLLYIGGVGHIPMAYIAKKVEIFSLAEHLHLHYAYTISRVLYPTYVGPPSFIYDDNHLSPLATYPPTLDEQPLIVGIHGLATHETYCRVYHYPRGGLLPRLLTLTLAGGHSLLRYYALTNIKPLTCVALCVARTFLPHLAVAAMERICVAKVQKISLQHTLFRQ